MSRGLGDVYKRQLVVSSWCGAMTWRARAAPVGQSVRAGCHAPKLNVRHHIRMSRSVTPAPPSIAAGFVLLRMRDRWEYFQTKPPGGDEHGYALLFRDAAGCGENPFAAAPASAVAGWVILLLACLLLANCAGTCILLGRTRRRRAELKRSASGEDEVLFVDT